jgi:hypothetical protein
MKNIAKMAHRRVARMTREKQVSTFQPQCATEFSASILDLGLFKFDDPSC